MNDLTTKAGVKNHMNQSTSAGDWDRRADEVKSANGGYPSFWFVEIMMSGLAESTAAKWNGDADIHIEKF